MNAGESGARVPQFQLLLIDDLSLAAFEANLRSLRTTSQKNLKFLYLIVFIECTTCADATSFGDILFSSNSHGNRQ